MVRVVEWGGYQGRGKWWCSYKRATLITCSTSILFALYVLHSLYDSLYIYSPKVSRTAAKYTHDQIKKLEESIRLRRAAEPRKLTQLIIKIKDELHREDVVAKLPSHLKQKIADEILQKLRSMDANGSTSMQKDMVEKWRTEKLEEVKLLAHGKTQNSTIQTKEAAMLAKVLECNWAMLLEEIAFWIPDEFINKEPDDKPDNEEDFESPIAGQPLPLKCKTELHVDYFGDAIRWGLTHHKDSAADCCEACLDQAENANLGEKACNIWVFCPSETGCYSPDIYEHQYQECWLKYAEKPSISFKYRYPESYRNSHPSAPVIGPWVAGVVSTN